MANFPITYAPEKVGSGAEQFQPIRYRVPASGVRIAQEVYNIGAMMQKKDEEKRERYAKQAAASHQLQIDSETLEGKIAIDAFDAETEQVLRGVTKPEEYMLLVKKRMQERAEISNTYGSLKESKYAINAYVRQTAVKKGSEYDDGLFKLSLDRARIAYERDMQAEAEKGNFANMYAKSQAAFENGWITQKQLTDDQAAIPDMKHKFDYNLVLNLAGAELKAEDGWNTDNALALIDKYVKDEAFTLDFKDKQELNNSVIDVANDYRSKAATNKYKQQTDATLSVATKIGKKELIANEYYQAGLDDEFWDACNRNQFATLPESDDTEAYLNVQLNILRSWTGMTGQKEAAEAIATSTFYGEEPLVSRKTYNWAIEQIKNPPQERAFATDIYKVITDARIEYFETRGLFPPRRKKFRKGEKIAYEKGLKDLYRWLGPRLHLDEERRPSLEVIDSQFRMYLGGHTSIIEEENAIARAKQESPEDRVIMKDSMGKPYIVAPEDVEEAKKRYGYTLWTGEE